MSEKIKKSFVPKSKSISNDYIKQLENEKNMILETQTKEFIDTFFDLEGFGGGGKELYYDAFFMLKKGFYPRKYIYFILYFAFKKAFKQHNVKQLQGLEGFFAKTTLNSAVASYCKNKPFDASYIQYYQPESFFRKIKRKLNLFFSKSTKKTYRSK